MGVKICKTRAYVTACTVNDLLRRLPRSRTVRAHDPGNTPVLHVHIPVGEHTLLFLSEGAFLNKIPLLIVPLSLVILCDLC